MRHSISAAALSVSLLGVSLSLAGRSSGEILNITEAKIPPRQPKRILVANFDTSKAAFNVTESGDSLVAFVQNTANRLADHLSTDITTQSRSFTWYRDDNGTVFIRVMGPRATKE